jgi:hypothetical protein
MDAQKVRTVIVSLNDLVAVHTALDLLRAGKPLTAVQSGVMAEEAIANLSLIDGKPPVVLFDGFKYTVFFFTTSG